MCSQNDHPPLVEQPRRNRAASDQPLARRVAPRLVTEAEASVILGVTENALRRLRASRRGPQPIRHSGGWFYSADRIERLAAIPLPRRMFAISYSSY